MQAILHASQNEDEFVKEYLVTYEKVLYDPLVYLCPFCTTMLPSIGKKKDVPMNTI